MERRSIGYLFEHAFSDQMSFRQNLRVIDMDMRDRNLQQGAVAADGLSVARNANDRDNHYRNLAVDNHLQFGFDVAGARHTMLLGLEYLDTDTDTLTRSAPGPALSLAPPVYGQTVPALPVTVDNLQTQKQTGLYVQDTATWGPWNLTAGLRRDEARTRARSRLGAGAVTRTSDAATTGALGLSYAAANGVAPYVSYSRSFEPQAGTDAAGNPFVPTEGVQYEAGVKYRPADSDSLFSAALYQLTRQNVLTPDPVNPAFRVQTGEVRMHGLELEAKAALSRQWSVLGAYTYQKGTVTASNNPAERGKLMANAPRSIASLWLRYTGSDALQGWRASLGARHTG